MMNKHSDLRSFRRGAWDLRRIERRKEQVTIEFPDRRKDDRRTSDKEEDYSAAGMLMWVDNSELDE